MSAIPELDGVRAIASLSVLAMHMVVFMAWAMPTHPIDLLTKILSEAPTFRWIVQYGLFAVDTFFVLSGFLLAQSLYREEGLLNGTSKLTVVTSLRLILGRFLRLGPMYAIVALLYTAIGSPDCPNIYEFLNIQNLVHPARQNCITVSWYNSIDFQSWILCVSTIYVLNRLRFRPTSVEAVLWTVSLCGMLWRAYLYKTLNGPSWPAFMNIQDFLECNKIERVSDVWQVKPTYNCTHASVLARRNQMIAYEPLYHGLPSRFHAVFMGFAAYLSWKNHSSLFKLASWHGCLTTSAALMGIILSVHYGPYAQLSKETSLLYEACYRHVFCIFVVLLLLRIVSSNEDPVLKPFRWLMKLPLWRPISTLSYAVYLIHPLLAGASLYLLPPKTLQQTSGSDVLMFLKLGQLWLGSALLALPCQLVEKLVLQWRERLMQHPAGGKGHKKSS
jgi:peptidoglycan/LPS O-acetylase OafA/YrhL